MADNIRAGRLRERVQIQENTPTANARGQSVAVWATVASVWAEVIPTSGSENEEANKLTARRRFNVTIRPYAISTKTRLKWRDVFLSVNGVLPVGIGRAAIMLTCTEVAA